ncbi:hypothetical protein [[Pseudomonas] boreopolis]|uniref:hypothetical protein n=1 Tax=Xanthomonas boreopolis TaxID=86183 RepID=UPI003D9AE95E
MSKILTFFIVLLFGGFSAVENLHNNISRGTTDVVLRHKIMAVTEGAALYIDISSKFGEREVDPISVRDSIVKNIPKGCIRVVLKGEGDAAADMKFEGGVSYEPGRVWIILRSDKGVPTWHYFDKMSIQSCMDIDDVKFFWKNYSK